jgi:hypothetical protein
MREMIKCTKKVAIYLSIFFMVSLGLNSVLAQGGPADDSDIPDIPLDGGLSILLAAGAAYGGKKLYDSKKNKENGV